MNEIYMKACLVVDDTYILYSSDIKKLLNASSVILYTGGHVLCDVHAVIIPTYTVYKSHDAA